LEKKVGGISFGGGTNKTGANYARGENGDLEKKTRPPVAQTGKTRPPKKGGGSRLSAQTKGPIKKLSQKKKS